MLLKGQFGLEFPHWLLSNRNSSSCYGGSSSFDGDYLAKSYIDLVVDSFRAFIPSFLLIDLAWCLIRHWHGTFVHAIKCSAQVEGDFVNVHVRWECNPRCFITMKYNKRSSRTKKAMGPPVWESNQGN